MRYSTEFFRRAVIPRAPVPTAVKVFMPPAMLPAVMMILLSFTPIRHKIIHPIKKYINALINLIKYHSIEHLEETIDFFQKVPKQISARQRLAMRSTRFNSFCDIVESLIHISSLWLLAFGNHQSLLLAKFFSSREQWFWWHRDVCDRWTTSGSCRQLSKKRSVFTWSPTIRGGICHSIRRCRCSRRCHNACADEDFFH